MGATRPDGIAEGQSERFLEPGVAGATEGENSTRLLSFARGSDYRAVLVFQRILAKASEVGASNVHICAGVPWKWRVHGQVSPIDVAPMKADEIESIVRHVIMASKACTPGEIDKTVLLLKDFDCSYSLPGVSRFRVNICRQRGTLSMVLRLLPMGCPSVKQLGMPPVLRRIAEEQKGLILVTGGIRSGKSTTLAALVREINEKRVCKIITIEDPIEYLHKGIRAAIIQREIGSDTRSPTKALEAALRQDPDVIVIGEIRDRETMSAAVKASEDGPLVLATFNAVSVLKTLQYLLGAFEPSEQEYSRPRLARILKAVIAQKLVSRKDSSDDVPVLEILLSTPAIRECIENRDKTEEIPEHMAKERDSAGTQTFDQHLAELYEAGIISRDTARSVAACPAAFNP